DLSYARSIPNLVLMAPADENECRRMLQTAYEHPGPALVRYPRGTGPGVVVDRSAPLLAIGRGEVRRHGRRVALLSFGGTLATALTVGEELNASVANMRFVKPLDEALVLELADGHDLLVTIEENAVKGGAGSAVNELLLAAGRRVAVINQGLPDRFIDHATPAEQREMAGLDAPHLLARIREALGARGTAAAASL
ncbi:MAG: 1-deoxy-D-xylulose-5-phosphate synthase, partial [Acidobacteria bacterium]|nr:1-deoxy-D-xylulose-5-phosphate synthase [Acidobacteriota bacterium]